MSSYFIADVLLVTWLMQYNLFVTEAFMLEYVTTSTCSVNSALSCGFHFPLSLYQGPSGAADSQNSKICYQFIPLVFADRISLSWACLVFLELYKPSLTSSEGPG